MECSSCRSCGASGAEDKLTDPHPVWKSRFWPYRTCLASMDGKDWKVITLNEAWGNLADAQAVYTGVPRRLITVVTEEPLELKTLWMSKEEMEAILVEQQDQVLEESVEPKPVEGEVDDEEAEVPGFADVDLPAVEVEGVPIDAAPNRLIVNGEEITAESSLRKMREAAKFLKIAIGGAKSKVWAKLVNCHLQAMRRLPWRCVVNRWIRWCVLGLVSHQCERGNCMR